MWTAALAATAAGLLAACSGSSKSGSSNQGVNDGWASVQFQLPSGTVTTANYTITGPNGFSETEMINAADDAGNGVQEVAFLVDSLPPGSGYMLKIAGSNTTGESCSGTYSFDVMPQQGATVNVMANCTGAPYVPDGYGSVDVWATLPAGLAFSSVSVLLNGPAGAEVQDTITVAAGGVHFTLNMVPSGMGQVLQLSAVTTDGSQTCVANSSFDVTADMQATTTLSSFQCNPTTSAGGH